MNVFFIAIVIAFVLLAAMILWLIGQSAERSVDKTVSVVAETSDDDPREDDDEPHTIEIHREAVGLDMWGDLRFEAVSEDDDDAPRACHDEWKEHQENWEYQTQYVDPNVAAKHHNTPIPSDILVLEQNSETGDYRERTLKELREEL